MAKKRTLVPFYGKPSQRADQIGTRLMRAGKLEEAKEYFDKSKALRAARKDKAHVA